METIKRVYAFVDTVEKAHQVASHIYLQGPLGVSVGFNESKRGEGYVIVDTSIDIVQIVRDVTGEDPIRVLMQDQITAEPDMWGIQAVTSENDDSRGIASE
ncbi:MAG: hypothetical protein WD274_03515 [Acidimicrobiia bacterium]